MKQPPNLIISEFQSHGFVIETMEGKIYRLNFQNAVNTDIAEKYVYSQDSSCQIYSCEPIYSKKDRDLLLERYPNETGFLDSSLLHRLRNKIFFARAKTVGYEWDYASRFAVGDKVYPTGAEQKAGDILASGFESNTLYTICSIDDEHISVKDSVGNIKDVPREKFIPGLSESGKWTDSYVYRSEKGSLVECTDLRKRPLKDTEFIHVSDPSDGYVRDDIKTPTHEVFCEQEYTGAQMYELRENFEKEQGQVHAAEIDVSMPELPLSDSMEMFDYFDSPLGTDKIDFAPFGQQWEGSPDLMKNKNPMAGKEKMAEVVRPKPMGLEL